MDQERWLKIEGILDKALAMENPEKQEAFVEYASQDDKKLFREVIDLLRSIEKAEEEDFLG